ncbi:unnamed protein product [Amoebophrya sp. A120]|nr:unnamed protein product [Amoebophrya sp. A120]|eukprot:GSA120T00003261001.1
MVSPAAQYQVGESVDVWSNSKNAYLRGFVRQVVLDADGTVDRGERVPPGSVFVEYAGIAKWIMERDIERLLQKVDEKAAPSNRPPAKRDSAAERRGSNPQQLAQRLSVQNEPPMLCKWGCGHQVQPGLTRNLNPYDTCCKKCGTTKGQGGHDPNCPGPPVDDRTPKGNNRRKSVQPAQPIADQDEFPGVSSFSVPEIFSLVKSTQDLQGLVRDHIREFGGRDSLNRNQLTKSYKLFCHQALVDDDFQQHWKRHMGSASSEGGIGSADLLKFYRSVAQENLQQNLKPEKLEIQRKMLIRQNPGQLEQFYSVGKKLGEGSFGSVHLVQPRSGTSRDNNNSPSPTNKGKGRKSDPDGSTTTQMRVCKSIKLDGFNEGSTLNDLIEEINIMAELDHPNVIKVFEYFRGKKQLDVIMELCEGGELWDRFKRYEKSDAVTKERWVYATVLQILRALAFMHDTVRIAHKDLKPENVLLVSPDSDTLKIIDFGLAEKFQKGQNVSDLQCGTPLFSAPEILRQQPFDFKVDVWSCGVLMYHMLENTGPFPAQTMEQLKKMVCTNAYKIPNPTRKTPGIPPDCVDCCLRMMCKNATDRPKASEVFQHPWMTRMQAECAGDVKLSPGVCQILENFHNQSEIKKAIYLYIAYFSNMSNKHAEPVRVLFSHLDKLNTGRIAQADIKDTLMRAGFESRAHAGAIAYSLCRRKNSAGVGYTEFLAAVCSIRISTKHHELIRQAFNAFDRRRKGNLEIEDLVALLNHDKNQDQVAQAIRQEFFQNGNNVLSYDDFFTKMRQVGATSAGDQLKAVH